MADNRKYYYLKLYLKSLKNGGKLQLDEHIPYTAQMIATLTRQQVGTVERALQIFLKLGLVEPLPDRPPAPAGYGKYQNIFLSDKELSELKAEYPAECEDYIERFSRYIASSGKKYQSHAATIRYWIAKDREKAGKKKGHKPLIVTTNLSLQELQNPEKTAYAQIYDRLLEIFPLSQSEYGGGNCRLHSKNICGSEQNQTGTDITGGSSATEDAMCRE